MFCSRGFSYLNSVTGQIPSHAASAILDGQSLVALTEGGGLLWVETLMVLCREMTFKILLYFYLLRNSLDCVYVELGQK